VVLVSDFDERAVRDAELAEEVRARIQAGETLEQAMQGTGELLSEFLDLVDEVVEQAIGGPEGLRERLAQIIGQRDPGEES